ncbi:MAG TPA: RebB family R body protein [Rhizomicrobium sp.]
MAIPTPLNGQITDAVTQANVSVIGGSPATTMMSLTEVSAQAFALMMQNAVTAQQQLNMIGQAATARTILLLENQS